MRAHVRRRFAARLLLGAVLVLSACAANPAREPSRVIAIGDVHGAYDSLLRILGAAGLVDAVGHWVGGDATLVQTGDLIDRGADDREVLELMMRLEKEARRAGGRVVALLGNHEAMNLYGDLRYVSRESFASFADASSHQRLKSAYETYLGLEPLDAQRTPQAWQGFMSSHPKGYLEHREAFASKGHIGRWLRRRETVAKVGDVVFLHGGLHPDLASRSLRQLNDQIDAELSVFDAAREYLVKRRRILPSAAIDDVLSAARAELESSTTLSRRDRPRLELLGNYWNWLLVHPSGPLWFRGLANWPDEELAERVPKLLEAFRAEHIVIGHTAQLEGAIISRLDGKVFLIDTGMLDGAFYPGGMVQALEIVEGRFQIIDEDGTRTAVRDVVRRAKPETIDP